MSEEKIISAQSMINDSNIELVLYRLNGEERDYRIRIFSEGSTESSYFSFNNKEHAEYIEQYFKTNPHLTSWQLNHEFFAYIVDNNLTRRETLDEIWQGMLVDPTQLNVSGEEELNVSDEEASCNQIDENLNKNSFDKKPSKQNLQYLMNNSSMFFNAVHELKDTVPNHISPQDESSVPTRVLKIKDDKNMGLSDVRMRVESSIISKGSEPKIGCLEETQMEKLLQVLKTKMGNFENLEFKEHSPTAIQINCSLVDKDVLMNFFKEHKIQFSQVSSQNAGEFRVLINSLKNFINTLDEPEQDLDTGFSNAY